MQKISHHIFKKQKTNNNFANYKMGILSSKLNLIRTKTRSAEIAAISAFRDSNGKFIRTDIIEALNRLSSLFYILMDKYSDKKSDL
jgi:ethanolamine utilization cobalamin adenosyltransferase